MAFNQEKKSQNTILQLPTNEKQLIINFHALIFHKQTFQILQINNFLSNSQIKLIERSYLVGFENCSKPLAEIPFLCLPQICKVPKRKLVGEALVTSELKLPATCMRPACQTRVISLSSLAHPFPDHIKSLLARDYHQGHESSRLG